MRVLEQRSLQGEFVGDVALHQAAITDGEATVDFESTVGHAFPKREFARLGRAVGGVEDSAVLVYGDGVPDFFTIESGNDSALEAMAGWRSIFFGLLHLESVEGSSSPSSRNSMSPDSWACPPRLSRRVAVLEQESEYRSREVHVL